MNAPLPLLSINQALAVADRILADPPRNAVRVSIQETASLAVLARQLHAIAEAAANVCRQGPDAPAALLAFAEGGLAGLLLQAGYLQPDDLKGPTHG